MAMESRNIIFIMLDTVRADLLMPYGGEARTYAINDLARKGIRYEMAIAPGTYTLPSHLSMFTGLRVGSIRSLRESGMKHSDIMTDPLLEKLRHGSGAITTAQVMEYFGYRSALFSNNPFVSEATGLAKGFSHISNIFIDNKIKYGKLSVKAVLRLIESDIMRKSLIQLACGISYAIPEKNLDRLYLSLRKNLNRHFSEEYGYNELDKGAAETNRLLRSYLKSNSGGRNFIFLNYMEGHEGYPTGLITKSYVEQDKWLHMVGNASSEEVSVIRSAYIKRIEYLDSRIAEAISIMKKSGVLDDATLIISSDHGQALMEHGTMFHNVHPYNEVSRVPLIISEFHSGRQIRNSAIVEEPFSLTEMHAMIAGRKPQNTQRPVITEHIGITEVWDAYLLRLLKKKSKNAESIYRKKIEQDMHATAVYKGRYKLVHFFCKRQDELYDLKEDPAETCNILRERRRVAIELLSHAQPIRSA